MICHVMGPTDNLSFACQAVAQLVKSHYLSHKSSVADPDSLNPDPEFQVNSFTHSLAEEGVGGLNYDEGTEIVVPQINCTFWAEHLSTLSIKIYQESSRSKRVKTIRFVAKFDSRHKQYGESQHLDVNDRG
jgi:hypothetical protein